LHGNKNGLHGLMKCPVMKMDKNEAVFGINALYVVSA